MHKHGATLQSSEQATSNLPRLAYLVRQFHRAMDLRDRRDTETMASLVRALSNPRGADAERFIELLRAIVQDEKGAD
jgi:hypothetical protein